MARAIMESILFIVEKTGTGFSAYAKDYPAYTTGSNMQDLRNNMLDAINSWFQHKGKQEVSGTNIEIQTNF